MYAISFSNEFYTLWDYEKYEFNGKMNVVAYYIKNLAKDLDVAKQKLSGKDYVIDYSLKGCTINTRPKTEKIEYPETQFSFGMLKGQEINTCEDIWQLKRAAKCEENAVTKQLAQNQLIQLGLIEYNGEFFTGVELAECKQEEFYTNLQTGYFYNEGEKVTLTLHAYNAFFFDTSFGTTFVIELHDDNNRKFKYMGSSPHTLLLNKNTGLKIKATIKHNNYKGEKQTLLQRITVINWKDFN